MNNVAIIQPTFCFGCFVTRYTYVTTITLKCYVLDCMTIDRLGNVLLQEEVKGG